MARLAGNIFPPLLQRRNAYLKDVKALKKVLAKFAFLYALLQGPVGRRDDADVQGMFVILADRQQFAFLQNTQEFGL